jgi:hypothetical protein
VNASTNVPPSGPAAATSTTRLGGRLLRLLATLVVASSVMPRLHADDAPPSRVDALFDLEVADKYLTPRGMIVADHGVTFQALFLAFVNVYKGAPGDFINDVGLVPGFWNDYTTDPIAKHLGKTTYTDWVEIDPIMGVSVDFAKNFKLDVTYTEFGMQILDIGTSQQLETKLSYNDSDLLGALALHPFVSYWKELKGKATAAANFGVPDSYYFDVGIDPGCSVGAVKIETPISVLLPSSEFYGEPFAKHSTVGLWEAGVKATMPATFMPAGYGHWSVHAGVNYMDFVDKNLQQESIAGGFGPGKKDATQIYIGMSTFF